MLWSARGALPRFYGDVLDVWRPWARDVTGRGLDASHFLVEDQPEEVAEELIALLDRPTTLPTTKGHHVHDPPRRQPDATTLAGQLKRTEIQHATSSIPGRDIVQVRTEIPVGVASGWHIHPGEEVGYIVAGTVQMEIEDQPTLNLQRR